MNFLGHLGVREVLVDQDAFNQLGVFNTSSCFLLNFDEVKIDIFSLKVSNSQNSLDSNLCKPLLIIVDNLRSQRNRSCVN